MYTKLLFGYRHTEFDYSKVKHPSQPNSPKSPKNQSKPLQATPIDEF